MPNQTSEKAQIDLQTDPSKQAKAFTTQGKPSSLFSTLPYYSLSLVIVLFYYSIEYLHQPYIIILLIYVLLPLLDNILPQDWLNPSKEQQKQLEEEDFWFKLPLYITTVLDWCLNIYILKVLTYGEHNPAFYIGAIVGTGSFSSINFIVAHELFHKHQFFPRFVGIMTTTKHLYMHFFIEHTYGHHINVATPEDSASSRLGEPLYSYFLRALKGSYLNAWKLENKRFKGQGILSIFKNRMVWFSFMTIAMPLAVYLWLGLKGVVIFIAIAAYSIFYLETVNYVEHYALERKKIGPNEYERINITHSWNAPHKFTNYLLFKLQRHSDHHENGYKPYQSLETYEDSPLMPHGYSFSVVMSFFPKIWFNVMHTVLQAYKAKKQLNMKEMNLIKSESRKVLLYLSGFCAAGALGNYLLSDLTY